MILSAHQPNFFPHYAIFEKMAKSDIFILLNHVQYEKNGYQNRFNLNGKWYTMSVNRGLDPIYTKKYINYKDDWRRIKATCSIDLSEFDDCISERLTATNNAIIFKLKEKLGINTAISLDLDRGLKSTRMLVDLCKQYGATKYLSGPSGMKYLDVSLFEAEGIKVEFQEPSESKPILYAINGL